MLQRDFCKVNVYYQYNIPTLSLIQINSLFMKHITTLLAQKTNLDPAIVDTIISLIQEGNTIPFIARYRKEVTGWATDTQLREFEEIYMYQQKLLQHKEDTIRKLEEKWFLTDKLRQAIDSAEALSQVEDLYRPYKNKKNTRATKAIAKGLQPLAEILLTCHISTHAFEELAKRYVQDTWDKDTSVVHYKEAIQWSMDIVAEIIADDPKLRTTIKTQQASTISVQTKATKNFEENGVYKTYQEYTKPLATIPSYAYLAISRAEKEKQLRLKILLDEPRSIQAAVSLFVPHNASSLQSLLIQALTDGIKRLLHPSLERELRSNCKERCDREAIGIFGSNMSQLLLSSPVRGKTIMGFDPAYRTWCKIAIIDETWTYLDSTVIYPTEPQNDKSWATKKLLSMIQQYTVWLICIGNGTASRESEQFVADMINTYSLDTKYLIVSEAGASVYSASALANEEYPNLDVTIRGAINIAQRVQDPLATYVKIDPKSLGVWQYQHDVDQKLLKQQLEKNIEDTVNSVGVDINTASRALLQHIAWISLKTAQNITLRREANNSFTKRSQIKKVKGLGPKAYEQCAWFLRINGWKELLDSTGIHPESYAITYEILKKECWVSKKKLTLPYIFEPKKPINDIAEQYEIGVETLEDIIAELANPWLDPRTTFDESGFRSWILTMQDLEVGMQLTGTVRNIVDFGAFVDIWLKNDGLVHKSQLLKKYVTNVFDVLNVWQQITVIVKEVDIWRKRVSLSTKIQ